MAGRPQRRVVQRPYGGWRPQRARAADALLEGKLQERYGFAKEEVRQEISDWLDALEDE